MRPFAHDFDVGEAEFLRFHEELVERELRLAPPHAGVAHRVEHRREGVGFRRLLGSRAAGDRKGTGQGRERDGRHPVSYVHAASYFVAHARAFRNRAMACGAWAAKSVVEASTLSLPL